MKKIFYFLFFTMLLQVGAYCQTHNPFSIIRSDSVVEEAVLEEIVPVDESTKIEGDNPFTVSHIPIRKNQYDEIERLAISRSNVEENISLSYLPLWLIVLSLCLAAYMLFIKKDHIGVLIRSLTNENFMRLSNNEVNGGKSVPYVLGYFIFLLNIALFVFLYLTKQFDISVSFLYLKILLLTVVFYIGKHAVNSFFSWVFHLRKESRLYDFTIISIYNLMSIVFLSLNIFMVFGRPSWVKPLVVVGVLFYIIALLSRYYKGLRIGQNQLNSYFVHFFLYFCAFEFSPWVILYSMVKDFI